MRLTKQERVLRATEAAHLSWAKTPDRAARTAPARRGLDEKFLRDAGGDPLIAASLRKAHFARMSRLSIAARRRRTTNGKNVRPGG